MASTAASSGDASTSASLYTGSDSIAKSKEWPEIIKGGSLLLAFQLANRRVLIVGGGNVAADRLRSVLPTGAKVTLVTPEDGMGEEVRHRVDRKEEYGMEVRLRGFVDEDITEEDWDMVLTALDDPELSKHIHALAKARHFTINVADVPPLCDFYFGSVIRRGALQVMISTNGKGPRLANRVRRMVEATLPKNVGRAIENVGELRGKLRRIENGADKESVKKRMEFMVRLTDSWSLDELAVMSQEEQAAVLDGFKRSPNDYAKTQTASTGRYYRRLICPYWLLQLVNPRFYWNKCTISPEEIEDKREKCPVYKGKSSVESRIKWFGGALDAWLGVGLVSGTMLGAAVTLLGQQVHRRYLK